MCAINFLLFWWLFCISALEGLISLLTLRHSFCSLIETSCHQVWWIVLWFEDWSVFPEKSAWINVLFQNSFKFHQLNCTVQRILSKLMAFLFRIVGEKRRWLYIFLLFSQTEIHSFWLFSSSVSSAQVQEDHFLLGTEWSFQFLPWH